MQAIWKIVLRIADAQVVNLPRGSEILCVQMQRGEPCIWFKVPDVQDPVGEPHEIRIYGTGNQRKIIDGDYIGTIQMYDGGLIFHVYSSRGA